MNKQILLSLSIGLLLIALPACCCKKNRDCQQSCAKTEHVAETVEVNSTVDKF